MKTISEISNSLRQAVESSGLTQTEICEMAGVQRMTLYRMLTGKENFSITSFLAVAYVLKLDLLVLTEKQSCLISKFSLGTPEIPRVPRMVDEMKNL